MKKGAKAAVAVMAVMVMCMMGCKKGQEAVYFPGFGDNGEYCAWPEAAENFNTPKDNEGYLARAVAYIKAGEAKKAVEDCRHVLYEGDEEKIEILAIGTLVWACINAGDWELAFRRMRQLNRYHVRSGPEARAWVCFMLGNVDLLMEKKWEEVKKNDLDFKKSDLKTKSCFETALYLDERYRDMIPRKYRGK